MPQTTAWGSDEQVILPQGVNGESKSGIMVTQEIGIRTETAEEGAEPPNDDWGYNSSKNSASARYN